MSAPAHTDRQADALAWRELSRRLYVELFYCDQQMRSTTRRGKPIWTQGSTVRDVLADAKAALERVQRIPLQHHAADQAQRVADLEALVAELLARLRDCVEYVDEEELKHVAAYGEHHHAARLARVREDAKMARAAIARAEGGAAASERAEPAADLEALMAEMLACLRLSRGNVASLGPAMAIDPYTPYRPWLAELDRVIAKAERGAA